jgi:hypothetical protein
MIQGELRNFIEDVESVSATGPTDPLANALVSRKPD